MRPLYRGLQLHFQSNILHYNQKKINIDNSHGPTLRLRARSADLECA